MTKLQPVRNLIREEQIEEGMAVTTESDDAYVVYSISVEDGEITVIPLNERTHKPESLRLPGTVRVLLNDPRTLSQYKNTISRIRQKKGLIKWTDK